MQTLLSLAPDDVRLPHAERLPIAFVYLDRDLLGHCMNQLIRQTTKHDSAGLADCYAFWRTQYESLAIRSQPGGDCKAALDGSGQAQMGTGDDLEGWQLGTVSTIWQCGDLQTSDLHQPACDAGRLRRVSFPTCNGKAKFEGNTGNKSLLNIGVWTL